MTTRDAYAAPPTPLATEVEISHSLDVDRAETVRREYLGHEAALRSVGSLYLFVASLLLAIVAFVSVPAVVRALLGASLPATERVFALLATASAGGLLVVIGLGIARLRPWCRGPAIALSGLGLVLFPLAWWLGSPASPLGAALNAYVLYLFASRAGRTVLSAPYARAICLTPYVRYRTTRRAWLGLAAAALAGFALCLRAV